MHDRRATSLRPRSLRRLPPGRARDACGRSRLVRDQEGRDRRAGRRIGLGQIGHRAVGAQAPALSRRAPSLRRDPFQGPGTARPSGRRDPPRARQRYHHHLPGADDLAQSAPHHREADRRDPAAASGRDRRGRARAHDRAVDARSASPSRQTRLDELSAPAFRRPAPARDDRHGARQRARPAHRRRADDRARRHRAGADPQPAQGAADAARHGDAVHHPRPRHRAQARRHASA